VDVSKPVRGPNGGARPGAGRKRTPRRLEDYFALGDPPADEGDAMAYVFQTLKVSLRQAMLDAEITDRERRGELRVIARAMHSTYPRARQRKAEKALREDSTKIKAKVAVELEPAPTGEKDKEP